jgi:hypothetical protein
MSDDEQHDEGLRGRIARSGEDAIGRLASELLDNPLVTGAIGRIFEAREKASQAQAVAFGALNLPSAADLERLTRRVRSVSQRLESIEDGVDKLDRRLGAISAPASEQSVHDVETGLGKRIGAARRAARRAGQPGAPAGGRAGAGVQAAPPQAGVPVVAAATALTVSDQGSTPVRTEPRQQAGEWAADAACQVPTPPSRGDERPTAEAAGRIARKAAGTLSSPPSSC